MRLSPSDIYKVHKGQVESLILVFYVLQNIDNSDTFLEHVQEMLSFSGTASLNCSRKIYIHANKSHNSLCPSQESSPTSSTTTHYKWVPWRVFTSNWANIYTFYTSVFAPLLLGIKQTLENRLQTIKTVNFQAFFVLSLSSVNVST